MFFKKDSTETEKNFLVKTCALLIYAAKIDENYTCLLYTSPSPRD